MYSMEPVPGINKYTRKQKECVIEYAWNASRTGVIKLRPEG